MDDWHRVVTLGIGSGRVNYIAVNGLHLDVGNRFA